MTIIPAFTSLPGGLYRGRPVPAVLPLGAVLLVVHWSCGSLPLRCTCVQRGDQASLSVCICMGWVGSNMNPNELLRNYSHSEQIWPEPQSRSIVMIIMRSLLTLLIHTSPIFHSCSGVRLTTSPDVFQVSRDSSFCLLWCLLWLRTQVCLSSTKNSKSSFCTISRVNVLIISCIFENAKATFYLPDPTASVNYRLEIKEKYEQFLRSTVGSKLCGMLRRSYPERFGWADHC